MTTLSFTKKKFLKLDPKQRHKKCSEILRSVYEKLLLKQYILHLLKHYNELSSWLNIDSLNSQDLKEIADRYHFHLKQANVSLKEHILIPTLKTLEGNSVGLPFLQNAIYLNSLRSAYNVGNIIRTTEALRIGNVYFD